VDKEFHRPALHSKAARHQTGKLDHSIGQVTGDPDAYAFVAGGAFFYPFVAGNFFERTPQR
jgi:hypothetical protein